MDTIAVGKGHAPKTRSLVPETAVGKEPPRASHGKRNAVWSTRWVTISSLAGLSHPIPLHIRLSLQPLANLHATSVRLTLVRSRQLGQASQPGASGWPPHTTTGDASATAPDSSVRS